MTREETKKDLWSRGSITTLSKVECNDILDNLFDYFENTTFPFLVIVENQALKDERANITKTHALTIAKLEKRIKELETPKTCEGCKHFFEDDFAGCKLYEKDFTRCSRHFESDYYEPKESISDADK